MPMGKGNALGAIKCSICGERIQVSSMGDHVCKSTVEMLRNFAHDRFNVELHPQLQSAAKTQRKANLPRIDPKATGKSYHYAHDQLTPQSSTWESSPGTYDGYELGSTSRSISRKPVHIPGGMEFHPTGYPPSPDQSPIGPRSQDLGRHASGVEGAKNMLHKLDTMTPGPFQAGTSGGPSKYGMIPRPSVDLYHPHAAQFHQAENERPRRMPEPDYYAPVRPLSTRSSRGQLRNKPSRDWGQPPIPRKPSAMSLGGEENSNYIAATKLADQHRLNRAETDLQPNTGSVPAQSNIELEEQSNSSRFSPRSGNDLSRKPSQGLDGHHRIPSSSTPPPAAELPKRPLRQTPSSSLLRSASRSRSPLTLGTGAIPPPMSISEAPPPPPPPAAYTEYSSGNPHASTGTHNTNYSISSSSTSYSGSSAFKSGVSSITTPSTSEVDLRISSRASKPVDKLSEAASSPEEKSPKPSGHRRYGSKRSYSIWEIESLTQSLLLAQQQSSTPAVPTCPLPACPPEHIPPRPVSPVSPIASTNAPSRATSRATSRAASRVGHRRTTTAKGICRGCSQPIYGKSVSSADGRITGRWHKPCFVCSTCREPFSSAEFYVLDNLPYCERHYHELNFSLCPTCDKGIEGPCLETEHRQRFHPHCFTCSMCHEVLAGAVDYYEVDGKPLCERHGRSLMQQQNNQQQHSGMRRPSNLGPGLQPPSSKVERRRTRLMFMDPNAPAGDDANDKHDTDERSKRDTISPSSDSNAASGAKESAFGSSDNAPSTAKSNNMIVDANPAVEYSASHYADSPVTASLPSPVPPSPIEKSPRHMGSAWQQQTRPQPQSQQQLQARQSQEQCSGMRARSGSRMEMGRMGLPNGPKTGLRAAAGGVRMNPMVRRPVDYYD